MGQASTERLAGGDYARWLDRYQQAYASADAISRLECPACGCLTLSLAFVVHGNDIDAATAAFWCSNCLVGIALGPCPVPPHGRAVSPESAGIPNYDLVAPE